MKLPPEATYENAGKPATAARIVDAAASGAALDPLAHLYVSNAGGALRTLLGHAHRHVIGTYPSWKTGLFQPFEGLAEQALIEEAELRHDVVDYQTQAFRLRMMIGSSRLEWICDHLRQYADGTVEAIEVKQHPGQMDATYVGKILRAREILAPSGWNVIVRYEDEIAGSAQWQRNRGDILAHRSAHLSDFQKAAFERLAETAPHTTFAALRYAMDPRPIQGTAVVHALICAGRIIMDLASPIRDESPVELTPRRRFNSRIRFA